jgi:hypothetical protein
VITVPKPQADVKIHAPDDSVGAAPGVEKPKKKLSKPIARVETKLSIPITVAVVIGSIGMVAAGYFLRTTLQSTEWPGLLLRALGLLAAAIPTAVGGYAVLRDQELEPYRGSSLWMRAFLCGGLYTILWIVYYFLPTELLTASLTLGIVATVLVLIGAGFAFACFDLDYGSGIFHYAFFVLVSLGLGLAAGLTMPWQQLR